MHPKNYQIFLKINHNLKIAIAIIDQRNNKNLILVILKKFNKKLYTKTIKNVIIISVVNNYHLLKKGGGYMYEFTNKEIRKQFKETDYGKKTNRWLYTTAVIALLIFIIGEIIAILYFTKVLKIDESCFYSCLSLILPVFFISSIIACYFDGKRDGAIEQFKRDLKK